MDIENLDEIVENAQALPGMGIKIVELNRDGDRAVYVAEIPAGGKVTPHYHPDLDGGTEWYFVVKSGPDAYMYAGKPVIGEDGVVFDVKWDKPQQISPQDHFVVPNGYVHSLAAGRQPLRFLFGCPDAHLDNDRDKVVLERFEPPQYDMDAD